MNKEDVRCLQYIVNTQCYKKDPVLSLLVAETYTAVKRNEKKGEMHKQWGNILWVYSQVTSIVLVTKAKHSQCSVVICKLLLR